MYSLIQSVRIWNSVSTVALKLQKCELRGKTHQFKKYTLFLKEKYM